MIWLFIMANMMPFDYYKLGCQVTVNSRTVVGTAFSTKYDDDFKKYAPGFPIAFLRVLAKYESDMNPKEAKGVHWGLLQASFGSVDGYNKEYGTSYTRNDLLKVEPNIRISTWALTRIMKSFNKYHGIQPDFKDPNFVALLLAGWNSGWSEKAGVGHVLGYLRKKGKALTFLNVWKYAKYVPGTTEWLKSPKKRKWQLRVAKEYFDEIRVTGEKVKPLWAELLPFVAVPAVAIAIVKAQG